MTAASMNGTALWALVGVLTSIPVGAFAQGASTPAPAALVDSNVVAGRYTQAAPGLLTAPLFTSEQLQVGAIHITDLLVGPHQRTAKTRVEVGALVEVHAGSAVLDVNGKTHEIAQGEVVVLKPGDAFSIDNRQQPRSLVARLIRIGDIEGIQR